MNQIIGYFTNTHSNQKYQMNISYYFYYNEGLKEMYIHLVGGPTGYESGRIELINEVIKENKPWNACMGNKDGYHQLQIFPKEMRKIKGNLENMKRCLKR